MTLTRPRAKIGAARGNRNPHHADARAELVEGRDGLTVVGCWWYVAPRRRDVYVRLERHGNYVGTVRLLVPRR